MNRTHVDEAYAVLGLRPGACQQEITQAWQDLTQLWDPSMHSAGSNAHEQAVRMRETTNSAYHLLLSVTSGTHIIPPPAKDPQATTVQMTRQPQTPDEWFARAKELESTHLMDAMTIYKRLAETGHAKAQFRLGYLYFEGVYKDVAKAAQWWKRAADQGHVGAQFNLGLMYERGIGMPLDMQQAYSWFYKAASAGDPQSQAKLESINETQKTITQELQKPSKEQPALGWAAIMKHRGGVQ